MSILWYFLFPPFVVRSKVCHLCLRRAKDKNEAVALGLFSSQEMGLDIFEFYISHQVSFWSPFLTLKQDIYNELS